HKDVPHMALFQQSEHRFADTLSRLIYANPFLPERIELERALLGADYAPAPWVYHKIDELDHEHPNLTLLDERVEKIAADARERMAQSAHAGEAELALYADLVTYLLYRRFRVELLDAVARGLEQPTEAPRVPFWKRFVADFKHFVALPGLELPGQQGPAYLLACLFQVRRAFFQIYYHISGAFAPGSKMCVAGWP